MYEMCDFDRAHAPLSSGTVALVTPILADGFSKAFHYGTFSEPSNRRSYVSAPFSDTLTLQR